MILRDYQQRAVDDVLDGIAQPTCLVAPTGAGKTVIGAEIVRRHGGRVLWVAHRQELLDQAAAHESIAGARVVSVQTLARREVPECDLLVIDEAHHVAADSYARLTDKAGHVLGLTATPFRLDGRPLKPPFERLVVAETTRGLCDSGVLVEPEVYALPAPDLSNVRTRAGDYAIEALGSKMKTISGNVVEHWLKLAGNRRTVVFCVNIEHAIQLAERFRAAGVAAESIDGTMADRSAPLARLASGKTKVITNCMLLGEGWDLPALEVAVLARPTKSLALHLQQVGRIMRACTDKLGALVIDHAGNHERLGHACQSIDYTLNGIVTPKPAKWHGLGRCPGCYMLLDGDWTVCPACGFVRPKPEVPRETDAALVRTEGVKVPFETLRSYWDALEQRREQSGYKAGWSLYRFKTRFGFWPVVADGSLVDPSNASSSNKHSIYLDLLEVARKRGYKSGWASYQFKAKFGHWPSRNVTSSAPYSRTS